MKASALRCVLVTKGYTRREKGWSLFGLTSGVGIPVLTMVFNYWKDRKNSNFSEIQASLTEINDTIKPTAEGTRAIIRYRLLQELPRYIRIGYISIQDKEDITLLYESYKNLGGNSVVSDLYEKVRQLPIKEV